MDNLGFTSEGKNSHEEYFHEVEVPLVDDHTYCLPTAQHDNSSFKSWNERLDSFGNLDARLHYPSARALADFGFYFIGVEDITRCHSCGKVNSNWKNGDRINDPGLHERDCTFFIEFMNAHEASKQGAEPIWYEDRGTQCSNLPPPYNQNPTPSAPNHSGQRRWSHRPGVPAASYVTEILRSATSLFTHCLPFALSRQAIMEDDPLPSQNGIRNDGVVGQSEKTGLVRRCGNN